MQYKNLQNYKISVSKFLFEKNTHYRGVIFFAELVELIRWDQSPTGGWICRRSMGKQIGMKSHRGPTNGYIIDGWSKGPIDGKLRCRLSFDIVKW